MNRRGPTALALVALLAAGPASALDTNDALRLTLVSGEVIEGWFVQATDGTIVLSGANRFESVPLAAVAAVERDGDPLPMPEFRAEVAELQAVLDAWRADPPPHPRPGVVAGASLLWAGSGHALLGEWRTAAGYGAVEAVLLGTIALQLGLDGGPAAVVPLAALDLVFRGWSAGDAARLARRRRAQLAGHAAPTTR